jgi:phage shock protein A
MTTEPIKQYTDLVQQSQEAVLSAVETWTKTMQEAFSSVPTTVGQFDPSESVDKIYDFTEKVLEMQRDFTKKLISQSASAAESAQKSVTDATQQFGQQNG